MRIYAILLAAGAGRRAGGPKALLTLGGETFLTRCVRSLHRPGIDGLFAVLGHDFDHVAASLPADVPALRNTRISDGMLSSVWIGLTAAAQAGADAVLIHPVDHPLVAASVVDALLAALQGGAAVAVPTWDGRRGHPTGFAASTWPALRATPLEQGARGMLAAHPGWITHVPADETCRLEVNTLEDLRALEARLIP